MKWQDLPKRYVGRLELLRTQKPHEILNVSEHASLDDVKAAYRRLVKIYHPDKADEFFQASNEEVIKLINDAYKKMARRAGSTL